MQKHVDAENAHDRERVLATYINCAIAIQRAFDGHNDEHGERLGLVLDAARRDRESARSSRCRRSRFSASGGSSVYLSGTSTPTKNWVEAVMRNWQAQATWADMVRA